MEPIDIYIDAPSPFGLARPTKAWCETIAAFDPDLRIFPSQKHPCFRLMRVARVEGPMNLQRFKRVMDQLHPDTQIALQHGLVAVFTMPAEIMKLDPLRVVEKLRRRDQWAFRDGDAVADALDQRDVAAEKEIDDRRRADSHDRRRAMRISYLYRTGARVSLVPPRRQPAAAASAPTTGEPVPPVAAVSAME